MEVLMRNLICTFLLSSYIAVFGTFAAFGQTPGLRVEADIPFDFTIGKTTFEKGSYEMRLTRVNGVVYHASLYNANGKIVMTTMAIQIGSTNRDASDMLFAANNGRLSLNKLRTPDTGFQFSIPKSDASFVAEAKKIEVQPVGSPN
jgi:hypothetical protein